MYLNRLSLKYRLMIFITFLLFTLLIGALLYGLSLSIFHFIALPSYIGFILFFREKIRRRIKWHYIVYSIFLIALIAAYMALLAYMIPEIRVRWLELPVAVWFLMSIYIIIWLLDCIFKRILSIPFNIKPALKTIRSLFIAKTLCRILCVMAIAIPYLLAVFMVHWIKFADNTNPEIQFGLDYEQVSFDATDTTKLKGWFIPSVRDKSNSTVIISPGRGTTKAGFLSYAKILCENGQNVLLFDHRGQGASSGHTRTFGLLETYDILGAVKYLRQFHPEGSKYIFALGISHGAPAVISAAAVDNRIQAVILDSAFISPDSFTNRITYWLPRYIDTYINITTRIFASALTGCNFFCEDNRYTDIAKISPRPVLIFHGTNDNVSDFKQAKKLYEFAKEPKKLCIIPGAGHAQILLYTREGYVREITETIIEGTLVRWR